MMFIQYFSIVVGMNSLLIRDSESMRPGQRLWTDKILGKEFKNEFSSWRGFTV